MKKIYLALWMVVLLPAMSCSSFIYDNDQTDNDKNTPDVYLSVATRAAHTAGEESINTDNVDFEDRVHSLALLIFDTATGAKIGDYFTTALTSGASSYAFTAKLTPGQRDFYFVANMPTTDLQGITTTEAMDTYMKTFRDLDTDHYLAASAAKGFPMSRVYLNQTITEGGTAYQPQPFKPVVNGTAESGVKLIRVVAKLEVNIAPATVSSVKDIYYKNAFRQFCLTAPQPPIYTPTSYYDDGNGNKLKKTNANSTYTYYMPEALMNGPAWSVAPHQPVNYFVMEMLDGKTYEIPIITYSGSLASADYLAFAKGEKTDKPDYNIYRNHHYKYTVNNLQTIEIIYEIDPWTQVVKSLYMGYGYNVSVDEDGNVTISNTVTACDPHSVKLETVAPFKFSDGSTSKTFDSKSYPASADYTLDPIPTAGQTYLKVYYNEALVKTFTK